MTQKPIDQHAQNAIMPDMSSLPSSELITVSEAARIVGVTVQAIHACIKSDPPKLSAMLDFGRYKLRRSEVEALAVHRPKRGRPKKMAECS